MCRDSNTVYVVVIGQEFDEPIAEHVFSIRSDADKFLRYARARWDVYDVVMEEWQRGRADGEQFIGTVA